MGASRGDFKVGHIITRVTRRAIRRSLVPLRCRSPHSCLISSWRFGYVVKAGTVCRDPCLLLIDSRSHSFTVRACRDLYWLSCMLIPIARDPSADTLAPGVDATLTSLVTEDLKSFGEVRAKLSARRDRKSDWGKLHRSWLDRRARLGYCAAVARWRGRSTGDSGEGGKSAHDGGTEITAIVQRNYAGVGT